MSYSLTSHRLRSNMTFTWNIFEMCVTLVIPLYILFLYPYIEWLNNYEMCRQHTVVLSWPVLIFVSIWLSKIEYIKIVASNSIQGWKLVKITLKLAFAMRYWQPRTTHSTLTVRLPSSLQYKTHFSRQLNCWSLTGSWSTACRRCSNYIIILHSALGFSILGKDNCKPKRKKNI